MAAHFVGVAWQSAPVRAHWLEGVLGVFFVSCSLFLLQGFTSKEKGLLAFGILFKKLKLNANGLFVLNFGEITKVHAQKSKNQNTMTAQPEPNNENRAAQIKVTCLS